MAPDDRWLSRLGKASKLVQTHVSPSPEGLEGVDSKQSQARPQDRRVLVQHGGRRGLVTEVSCVSSLMRFAKTRGEYEKGEASDEGLYFGESMDAVTVVHVL